MKKIKKRIKNSVIEIVTFVIAFPVIFLSILIILSDAKFSDFFTTERVSCLEKRDPRITKDIVVDATQIKDEGGIKTLTENLVKGMAEKRPNWRFIILIVDVLHDGFPRLKIHNNIKFLHVKARYNEAALLMRDVMDFLTLGAFRDKITQLCFYNTICIDDKCDLFFDPYAEVAINDFDMPKISLIHDLVYIDIPKIKTPYGCKWIKRNSDAIVRSSKKIVTVSNFSKKRIMEEYKVNDDFVRAIHIRLANRVSHNTSAHFSDSILKKYGLIKENYLIYYSTFWPHKNHGRLLEAFAKFLSSSSSDVKLAIVGKFWKGMQKSISEALSENNLHNKVIFTNFVPDEELNVLLSNSLALVFPSLYEGFGMPVIEAMAAGIPVISSNAGSLLEVAGDAALFFDPYNVDEMAAAIARIITDADLRKELIQKGYKQAAKFADTDAMIGEYLKLFEEVMENHRTSEISK